MIQLLFFITMVLRYNSVYDRTQLEENLFIELSREDEKFRRALHLLVQVRTNHSRSVPTSIQ